MSVARIQPFLGSRLASDTLAHLEAELTAVREDLADADQELAETREEVERRSGFLSMVGRMLEDLGLGLGWFGLYFTAFLALWRASFERFGGYVGSVATGMLGFLQILWDANRQGIHDKISETVVVRATDQDSGVEIRNPASTS